MTEQCIIALGSNLSEPDKQLHQAFDALGQLTNCRLLRCSSLYSSHPLGPQDQDRFVNAAALLETALSPVQLLLALQSIEHRFGRVKTRHWGERIIDLDIIFYGRHLVDIKHPSLTIPHPEALNRDFVLVPVLEICPDWKLPNGTALKDQLANADNFDLHKIN